MAVLSWREHLPDEDLPPRWMWHLDHEIEQWFDELDSRKGGDRDSDDGPGLAQNALSAQLRK